MTVDRKRTADTCPACRGEGRCVMASFEIPEPDSLIEGFDLYRECPTCGGTGTVPSTSAKSGRNRSA